MPKRKQETYHSRSATIPILSLISAVILILGTLAAMAFVDLDDQSTPVFLTIVTLVSTTLPSLIGAAYSERASKDIRNGTVKQKAKEGAQEALDETGVTEVVEMSQRGQSSILAMQALTKLLEASSDAVRTNTDATQANTNQLAKEDKENGTN